MAQIRKHWPKVKIILRADSGFCREGLMVWCEQNGVDYVFSLACNTRLEKRLSGALTEGRRAVQARGRAARVFRDFLWTTRDSWSRRRVVAKAEWTRGEANPRFIVTSLKPGAWRAKALYEDFYCARGDMENRIKECQLDLMADRTSAATLRANQLRLWLASLAYVLVDSARRLALGHTELENATARTIRLKLLKIGALVRLSVRRINVAIASSCPLQNVFALAHARLRSFAANGCVCLMARALLSWLTFRWRTLASAPASAPPTAINMYQLSG